MIKSKKSIFCVIFFLLFICGTVPVFVNKSGNLFENIRTHDEEPINIFSPEHRNYTEPDPNYYPSTFHFESFDDGSDPEEWIDYYNKGQIISGLDGHDKIYEMHDPASNKYFVVYHVWDISQTYGTVEFWVRTTDASKRTDMRISQGVLIGPKIVVPLLINNDIFQYFYSGSWREIRDAADNTWYHIRIDFETTINGYQGLDQYKWHVYIDNQKYGDYNTYYNCVPDSLYFISGYSESGYSSYLDAVGYSWDPYYEIGFNRHEGILLDFEPDDLDYMEYSYDDQDYIQIYGDIVLPWDYGTHTIKVAGEDSDLNIYQSDPVEYNIPIIITSPHEDESFTTKGHFFATCSFENDPIGEGPLGWTVKETGGYIKVNDNYLYHEKIVDMYRNSGEVSLSKSFSYRQYGTVEFYALPVVYKNYDIIIRDKSQSGTGYLKLRFASNGYLKYYDGSWHTINREYKPMVDWTHIKISWICDKYWMAGYWGLWVDGDYMGEFDFKGFTTQLNQIKFHLPNDHSQIFIDAIGFSWDSNYDFGDNLKEGLFLDFICKEKLAWYGYSLDNQPTITITGSTLIPMPVYGYHTIQVFGQDYSGNPCQSSMRTFFNYFLHNNNDEVLSWGIDAINAERVWGGFEDALNVNTNANGNGVKVLIIDSGIDYYHLDLENYDDDPAHNYDYFHDNEDPFDNWNGHGSMCAGIVAAADNGIGFVGVAPRANIYMYRITDDFRASTTELLTQAIYDAVETNFFDIISISMGGGDDYYLQEACYYAYDNDVIVVAAAGNYYPGESHGLMSPAKYQDFVIPVGAVDKDFNRAGFSCYGYADGEGIVAPGVNIGSTCVTNDYDYGESDYCFWSGTSFACPMVAGVIALILSAYTDLRDIYEYYDFNQLTDLIKDIIYSTANYTGGTGWDDEIGHGVIDAESAFNYTDLLYS